MPISKPQQIFGGGGVPVVKKARQSAAEQRHALNAAMGLDNFAKLLKGDAQAAGRLITGQQTDAAGQTGLTGSSGTAGLNSPALFYRNGAPGQAGQFIQPPPSGNSVHAIRQPLAGPPADLAPGADNPQILSRLQNFIQQPGDPLAIVKSLNPLSASRPGGEEGRLLARRAAGHRQARAGAAEAGGTEDPAPASPLGALSAMFESGGLGSAAIGYDRAGGTSYGKYQISSRAGSMDQFIKFLSKEEPAFAERLKKAGPADTGGRGGKMPQVWRELAAEQPERFERLQQSFIGETHFKPAMEKIKSQTGLSEKDFSPAMLEVVFSTAVQHGANAAGRIIGRALESVGLNRLGSPDNKQAMLAEQDVIRDVYKNRSRQFVSSTRQVREAVQGRLQTEMNMALGMLKEFFTA